ncbi:DUF1161 domain-containing protein [Phytobacter ursingii]|uniref:DUF1161 domain-containing protein n=1 Tax=Phytobacter ursingii TaxID=1972431 RepID=UPI000E1DD9B3|nr:DUF1161 domain-containing protein [Escherichia coli]
MKYSLWLGTLLFLGSASAYAAPDSCEKVKNDIQQRIINNGVPEADFTLTIEPNDQRSASGAQVVGHCSNDNWKIVYTRTRGSANSQSDEISPQESDKPAAQ